MTTAPLRIKITQIAFPIIFLVLASSSIYWYAQVRDLKRNPQKAAQEELQKLVGEVGKLIILPVGETPTIATVSDPEKLKDQPFFASAKQGDRVLIYTKARKAILYNPSTNKIVDVAPVTIGASSAKTP